MHKDGIQGGFSSTVSYTEGIFEREGLEEASWWCGWASWTLPGTQEDSRALHLLATRGLSCHSVSQLWGGGEDCDWWLGRPQALKHRRSVTVFPQVTLAADSMPATGGLEGCP